MRSNQADFNQLPLLISEHFSIDELKSLAFRLHIKFDDLEGDTRGAKSLALVLYLERRNRIPELLRLIETERPFLADDLTSIQATPPPKSPKNWSLYIIIFAILLFLAVGWLIYKNPFSLDRQPAQMPASEGDYQVRVLDNVTDLPIENANVILQLGGRAPITDLTDSNGYARIFIDGDLDGQPARLLIETNDYKNQEIDIDVSVDDLPKTIRLEPLP